MESIPPVTLLRTLSMGRDLHPWVSPFLSHTDHHRTRRSCRDGDTEPELGTDEQGGPREVYLAHITGIVWPPWYPGRYVGYPSSHHSRKVLCATLLILHHSREALCATLLILHHSREGCMRHIVPCSP